MQADRPYLVELVVAQRNSGLCEGLLKGGRDEIREEMAGLGAIPATIAGIVEYAVCVNTLQGSFTLPPIARPTFTPPKNSIPPPSAGGG